MLATVTWPVKPGFELTAIGRVASGAFFTPIVAGDINGDGLRNDRPFRISARPAAHAMRSGCRFRLRFRPGLPLDLTRSASS